MELEFDYKAVDWKALKTYWDKNPTWCQFKIKHGENILTFEAYVNKSKKIRLWLFINGWYKGEYSQPGHEFYKYQKQLEMLMDKRLVEIEKKFDRKLKKLTTRQIMEKKGIEPISLR